MLFRVFLSAIVPLFVGAAALVSSAANADASERERRFFSSVEGRWSGPGEIVAGKYRGTKFICNFTGTTPDGKIGMALDGGCRVGLFTQRMSAAIEKSGGSGYRGTFMDGAAGNGLDVVGGTVASNRVTFRLSRNALDGAMQARMTDDDTMNVTVSVKVENQMVPVIGISLKRLDERSVGAVITR
ncbi:MAG: hypothetical protein JJ913_16650 [Rhizobiaceae bacterium]|nr:hypothetical protein [Rhizobiaceae bacterium]